MEKEDFSSNCIIDIDTTLYERRDECYITILEYFCQEMTLHEEHQHYEGQTLDCAFRPKWLSTENNNQYSHIQPQIEESNSEGSCRVQRSLHQQNFQEKEAAENWSHQFYGPVVDYMETFFCQQQEFIQGYVQSSVY